jgi:AraC family transcriptional regulator of adaptative response/methylated-DNA-[protein]-cysteine methyltransferase
MVCTLGLSSPLGDLIAGATDAGVCLLEFHDPRRLEQQFRALRSRFSEPIGSGRHHHLDVLRDELKAYFAGTLKVFTVPLVTPGTPFEQRVWNALCRIPYGSTTSYEAIARGIGEPAAARAVGRANGMNRVAIVIPCHRVINKGRKLGGYGGGLWRKQHLLDLERGAQTLFVTADSARLGAPQNDQRRDG